MALKPGSKGNLSGSMAGAIQTSFNAHFKEILGKEPPISNKQMELLCIAVAEGVINHLKAHPEAFKVTFNLGGSENYVAEVRIE
jgi:hypothetical protein